MDRILIANESVEEYRHCKKKGMILKLDLEKAYTNLDFWTTLWFGKVSVVNG